MTLMEPILIRSAALREMRRHAREEYPLECCGLLWGRGKVIEGVVRTVNARRSRAEFEVAPRDLIDAMKWMRRQSREFMGVYHSHPRRPAAPSAKDAAEFYYRDASYWIVSLQTERAETRCYRWADGAFQESDYRPLD